MTFSNRNRLGNRCSILLSYRDLRPQMYASWRLSAPEICTICTQYHSKTWVCTSGTRVKHGYTVGLIRPAIRFARTLTSEPSLSAFSRQTRTTQFETKPLSSDRGLTTHTKPIDIYGQTSTTHLEHSMRFFKHFTDGHDSTSMMNLMDEWGVQGYGAFFILMELAIEKIDKDKDQELTEDHCRVRIHGRILRQKLRLSSTKLERFLNQCSTEVLLSFEKVEDEFHFFIPKILNFLDRDAKRARAARGPAALKNKIKIKNKIKSIARAEIESSIEEKSETVDTADKPPTRSEWESLAKLWPRTEGRTEGVNRLAKRHKTRAALLLFENALRGALAKYAHERTEAKFIPHFSTFVGTDEVERWRDTVDWTPSGTLRISAPRPVPIGGVHFNECSKADPRDALNIPMPSDEKVAEASALLNRLGIAIPKLNVPKVGAS